MSACSWGSMCGINNECQAAGDNMGCDKVGSSCTTCARGDFELMINVSGPQQDGSYLPRESETLTHLRPDLGGALVDTPGIANGNSIFQTGDVIKTINGYRADLVACWLAFETHSAEQVIVKYLRGGTVHTITIQQP